MQEVKQPQEQVLRNIISKEHCLHFFLLYLHFVNKNPYTHDLLLGISLDNEYSIMIDQESYQERPKKRNCKQLQKIGQCSSK